MGSANFPTSVGAVNMVLPLLKRIKEVLHGKLHRSNFFGHSQDSMQDIRIASASLELPVFAFGLWTLEGTTAFWPPDDPQLFHPTIGKALRRAVLGWNSKARAVGLLFRESRPRVCLVGDMNLNEIG